MAKFRIVLYVNQFYAGVGGEDKADLPPQLKLNAGGPAQLLSVSLGDKAELVGTVFCGDNYSNQEPGAIDQILEIIKGLRPDAVIAGPAFSSGRYGLACGAVCAAVQEKLKIPAVSGMHPDSPGVDKYGSQIYMVPTSERATGMAKAVPEMARLALKLAAGERLGPPEKEGYIPQGFRRNVFVEKTGAERAADMILKRIKGEPFTTEYPLPKYEFVPAAPPVENLSQATIAIVTEGGSVPKGNPDRIETAWATKWAKYPIANRERLDKSDYECIHGGFDPALVNQDPNRLVPIDAMRELEKEGAIGKLYDYFYSTTGNVGVIHTITRIGREMAQDLRSSGVHGVILTGT